MQPILFLKKNLFIWRFDEYVTALQLYTALNIRRHELKISLERHENVR